MNGQALMKYRFDILLNFLGTGDINTAKIWFMGIEEAQVWTKDSIHEIDLLETVLSKTLRPGSIPEQKSKLPHNEKFTNIYDIMSKIIIRLKDNRVKEWQEYRDKYLFTCGSDAFQLNIFPLGKKRVNSWPREYSEMFGYEKDDYLSTVRRYRFQHILHNRKQFGNPLTICFGKSCWEDFKECLNLQISTYTPLNPFVLYQHDRVILAPFFWYGGKIGMTDPRIETLVKCINDNKLNPFARDEVRSFL